MASLDPTALRRLRDTLQSHVDGGRIPGAIAVVGLGGHVEFATAVGRLDPGAATPMRDDAIFRIYSMTKPIVSLATLMLVEEGRLQLVDPVSMYLPAFAGQQVGIEEGGSLRLEPVRAPATVHDLLRHTAGLTYEFLGDNAVRRRYGEAKIGRRGATNAEFAREIGALPLAHQPGTRWEYSHATDVLGALVEAVAGEPLRDVLRRRIFEPLGMRDTAFSVPQAQWHRLAQPFERDPQTGEEVAVLDPKSVPAFESGGGGLMSTRDDYLAFMRLLQGRGTAGGTRLVSRKTIEWMTSDHLGAIPAAGDLLPPGHGFGLGLAVRTANGMAPYPGSAGQYFWSGIAGTFFFIDPAEDLFALLLLQAPRQRIFYRNLFRAMVYAALD